jgi:hypothetical protein
MFTRDPIYLSNRVQIECKRPFVMSVKATSQLVFNPWCLHLPYDISLCLSSGSASEEPP